MKNQKIVTTENEGMELNPIIYTQVSMGGVQLENTARQYGKDLA